jgi:AcrR family transcriptional regulator
MEASRKLPEGSPERERLLDLAVEHALQHGIGSLSLRGLAAALGTSHRMLIYYFGSREGLFVEVIRVVETRQREALAEIGDDPDADRTEIARRLWQRLIDPSLWPQERLFFEIYGQALQGQPHAVPLLKGIVDSWVEPGTELGIARGLEPGLARAGARLGLAVTRGLLLDLLATGDVDGVNDAMELYLELVDARLAGES